MSLTPVISPWQIFPAVYGDMLLQAQHKVMIVKTDSMSALGEVICQKAEEMAAALVVMPVTSRGGGTAHSEGSIVQYVVSNCHSAVLVWRPT